MDDHRFFDWLQSLKEKLSDAQRTLGIQEETQQRFANEMQEIKQKQLSFDEEKAAFNKSADAVRNMNGALQL